MKDSSLMMLLSLIRKTKTSKEHRSQLVDLCFILSEEINSEIGEEYAEISFIENEDIFEIKLQFTTKLIKLVITVIDVKGEKNNFVSVQKNPLKLYSDEVAGYSFPRMGDPESLINLIQN